MSCSASEQVKTTAGPRRGERGRLGFNTSRLVVPGRVQTKDQAGSHYHVERRRAASSTRTRIGRPDRQRHRKDTSRPRLALHFYLALVRLRNPLSDRQP